jgi:hypothetical protein
MYFNLDNNKNTVENIVNVLLNNIIHQNAQSLPRVIVPYTQNNRTKNNRTVSSEQRTEPNRVPPEPFHDQPYKVYSWVHIYINCKSANMSYIMCNICHNISYIQCTLIVHAVTVNADSMANLTSSETIYLDRRITQHTSPS